jgi:hypothetical protein
MMILFDQLFDHKFWGATSSRGHRMGAKDAVLSSIIKPIQVPNVQQKYLVPPSTILTRRIHGILLSDFLF